MDRRLVTGSCIQRGGDAEVAPAPRFMPRAGFEPAAYPLGGDRSIRLSYRGRWLIFTQTAVGCVNRLFPRITGDTPAGRIPCMSRAPLLDMSDPPFNVVHMSK